MTEYSKILSLDGDCRSKPCTGCHSASLPLLFENALYLACIFPDQLSAYKNNYNLNQPIKISEQIIKYTFLIFASRLMLNQEGLYVTVSRALPLQDSDYLGRKAAGKVGYRRE